MNIKDVKIGNKYIVIRCYGGVIGKMFTAKEVTKEDFIITDLGKGYTFMPASCIAPIKPYVLTQQEFNIGNMVYIDDPNLTKVVIGICVGRNKVPNHFLCSIDGRSPSLYHKDCLSLVTKPVSMPETAVIGIKDRPGFHTNQDLQPPTTIMVAEEELKEFPALALAEYNNFGIRAELV